MSKIPDRPGFAELNGLADDMDRDAEAAMAEADEPGADPETCAREAAIISGYSQRLRAAIAAMGTLGKDKQ